MRVTAATVVWCSAALVVAGGTFGVVTLGERHVGEQATINEQLAAQLAANGRAMGTRGALLTERGRLRAELFRLGAGRERAPVVARFVRDAARATEEHHATIASIAAPASRAEARAPAAPLETIPLAVTVEGRYADVLAVIRSLSALPVPAEVDVVSVVRTSRPGSVAVVATLHVVLQRVAAAVLTDVGARPY